EHGAAVLIEQHIVPHSFADDLQADSLSFERRGVWAIAKAFDGGLVHKVELNVAHAPFTNEGLIRRAHVLLRARVRRIERVQGVSCRVSSAHSNGLTRGI